MNSPSSSRNALRRLLIVLAVAAGLVIFSYGWKVTDIDLDRPQEPIRQQNVGNALRELLSPNVLEQTYEVQNTSTSILITCPADGSAPVLPEAAAPLEGAQHITIDPPCANSGDLVTVNGFNFYPDSLARINWIATDGERRIRQVSGTTEDNFITRADGSFSVEVEVPRIRGSSGEIHTVEAQGRFPISGPRFTETTSLVIEKMIETIFLALIATSISILPSAVLSFFAAHNLMRSVRMSTGSLLVSFILLPVGWILGSLLLGGLGLFALGLGKSLASGTSATVLFFAFGAVASSRLKTIEANGLSARLRSALNLLIAGTVFILALGLLGGLGLLIGSLFTGDTLTGSPFIEFIDNILGYIGNFLGSLGQLVELLIVPIGGMTGAFVASSVGSTLSNDLLRKVDITTAHVLGTVLGAVSGAILMGLTGMVAMQAAWFGLLPPIIAAVIGANILPMIYRRSLSQGQRPEGSILQVLKWSGAIVAFAFTFMTLNVLRAMVEGVLPSTILTTNFLGVEIPTYLTQVMLIGATLGAVSGGLASTKSNFPLGEVLYTATRTILNALRSIEPLIMGLVFVIWVGIGPFAGVLALTLHSIASLGKLYSEQIENIDAGPIEALQSTGANRLQTIMYAVVPQIIPPYIAFTMYRWDINVRMSTIIGFVGGGGVGFLLQQQINLLRYRDAGVAVLAIAIVVSVLDYASASIRERYI